MVGSGGASTIVVLIDLVISSVAVLLSVFVFKGALAFVTRKDKNEANELGPPVFRRITDKNGTATCAVCVGI